MRWPQDATGWPMAAYSRHVLHRPHRWHIQEHGNGPTVLLIHGAGSASQSFRGLFPILAQTCHTVTVDLPGQGFTQLGARHRCGLDHMAEDLLSLIRHEGWKPDLIVGHSAGAAIALRLTSLGLRPAHIVGINAALGNFKGVAGWLFPAMAKVLALTPLSANIFAATTTDTSVRNLIKGTGSVLDDEGIALYRRLASDAGHVDATLSMMAQWSLEALLRDLSKLDTETLLITGANDKAVPPQTSADAVRVMPNATHLALPALGHLAHEEDPAQFATIITGLIR